MDKNDPLLNLDPSEVVLHTVKRHPIGVVFIYIATIVGLLVNFIVLFLIIRYQDDLGLDGWEMVVSSVFIMFAFFILFAGYVSWYLYTQSKLVITNESIIQILQQGVFDRKVSQLNLSKVQDVTVDQEGLFSTMFGYGTLTIESAGEAANYRFKYANNPIKNSKYLVEAHEQYLNELYEKRFIKKSKTAL